MDELIKILPALALKFGISFVSICGILLVIYWSHKSEKEKLELRKAELKSYTENNNNIVDQLRIMTTEFTKSNNNIVELIAKNEMTSKMHNDEVYEVKKQVIAMHERVNQIGRDTTEIRLLIESTKNAIEKCRK